MNKKKIIYCFLLFSIFFLDSLIATTSIDSLLSILNQPQVQSNPSELQQSHLQLGKIFYSQEESFEESKFHLEKALEISRENNIDQDLTEILYHLGKAYQRINNYPKALECFFDLTEMDEKKYAKAKKAKPFGEIATIYQALGNFEKAFEFQMKALSINEQEKNQVGLSKDLYSLGTIFYYQKRYDQSLEYYLKSKKVCDELKSDKGIYACLDALGSVYSQLNDTEKSQHYANKALELAKKINYKTGIAYSQGNIASDLAKKNEYEKAEVMHQSSIQLKKELNDSWALTGGLVNLGDMYVKWSKPQLAINPLHEALKIAKDIESNTRIVLTYESLKEAHHALGNTDSAFYYLEKYVQLQDSLLNEKTVEEMGKTKNLYEIEKKEQEITLLKTKSKNQKLQKYIFIIVGIFLFLVCWGIFSRLKFERATNNLLEEKNEEIQVQYIELQHTQDELLKTNILLEENNLLLEDKNDEIEEKHKLLEDANKLLEDSNEDLKNFAYVASHDLKEPLRMVSSYTTLIKKRYHDQLDETGQEFMHYVVDGVDRMKVMLDDLLSYSRVGTQGDTRTWVDMGDIMVIVNNNLTPRLRDQNAKLVINEKSLPAIKANNTQMIQLLQNLVSNGIKFRTERDPVVTVDCKYDNNKYIFSVADNGIGISEENKKKVFEMFKRLHTREEYEGTGIGLATCKKIVSKHGGDIWVESVYGEGSTFFFSIPCPIDDAPTTNYQKKILSSSPSTTSPSPSEVQSTNS